MRLMRCPRRVPLSTRSSSTAEEKTSGKGVFLGEQYAVETGYRIAKLLASGRGLIQRASDTGHAAARFGEKPFGGVLCRDHRASYRNNHGVRTFAEQFAFAEGKGRQGNQRLRRWAGGGRERSARG